METSRLSRYLLPAVTWFAVVACPSAYAHCQENVLPPVHNPSNRVPPSPAGACTEARVHDTAPIHEGTQHAEEAQRVNSNAADLARTRIDSPHAETLQLAPNRWIVTGGGAGAQGTGGVTDAEYESVVSRSMNQLPFVDSRDWIHNPPEILREVRNYRRQGMPIIHLMQSRETTIVIGVSNHGKPGLYFTRKLPF
jgi:hypothetical protein